ncbi:hypothetical protein DFS34DRAFT_659388 [Phlyctochytrium arcticum]|nr:hypothetical protein DFS34DRAFT_659388 [Phlyctochytrium arcticum]
MIFSGACFLLCTFNLGDIGGEDEHGWKCQFQGPMIFATVGACTYILATTSLHQYLLVVRGRAASPAQQNLMLAVAWIFPGAFTLAMRIVSWSNPSLLAWSTSIGLLQGWRNEIWCAISRIDKQLEAAIVATIVMPPLLMMIFCYSSLGKYIYRVTTKELSVILGKKKEAKMYQIKAVSVMASFVGTFLLSWIGSVVTMTVLGALKMDPPAWFETVVVTLAHSSGLWNAIKYRIYWSGTNLKALNDSGPQSQSHPKKGSPGIPVSPAMSMTANAQRSHTAPDDFPARKSAIARSNSNLKTSSNSNLRTSPIVPPDEPDYESNSLFLNVQALQDSPLV